MTPCTLLLLLLLVPLASPLPLHEDLKLIHGLAEEGEGASIKAFLEMMKLLGFEKEAKAMADFEALQENTKLTWDN
jgi:hypothetical protein